MSATYAQGSDLASRYDARLIGDLCEDAGTRVPANGVPHDPNVIIALNDAASMINAACQVSQRYTQAQLAALTGADQNLLYRLNCDLAFVFLCQRRGVKPPMYDEAFKRSDELLTRLKQGELIFDVPGNVGSGTETINFISQVQYSTLQLLRDADPKLFPVRRQQQTIG